MKGIINVFTFLKTKIRHLVEINLHGRLRILQWTLQDRYKGPYNFRASFRLKEPTWTFVDLRELPKRPKNVPCEANFRGSLVKKDLQGSLHGPD